MTCIVGIRTGERIIMGADSFGSNGHAGESYRNRKVFKKSNLFLIGYTTSFRFGQILEHGVPYDDLVPELTNLETLDNAHFMTQAFIPALRNALKDGGYAKVSDGVETGGSFLLGFNRELFEIGSDFSWIVPECGYAATGSGYEFALGSLHTTRGNFLEDFATGVRIEPEKRVERAIEVASAHCCSVGGRIDIEQLSYGDWRY